MLGDCGSCKSSLCICLRMFGDGGQFGGQGLGLYHNYAGHRSSTGAVFVTPQNYPAFLSVKDISRETNGAKTLVFLYF